MQEIQDDVARARHKRNAMASQLLLRRLCRLHYEDAPYAIKSRYLPVPIKDVMLEEYTKQRQELVKSQAKKASLAFDNYASLPDVLKQVEDVVAFLKAVPIKLIIAVVARYFKISPVELLGSSRKAEAAIPRQILYFLARDISGYSYPEIGRRIGRDHSSVMSGVRVLQKKIAADPTIATQIETVRAQIVEYFQSMKDAA